MGSAPNTADLLSQSMGLNTSFTVNNIPIDGRSIYVTLSSYIGGQWKNLSYHYTTAGAASAAQIVTPQNGSTLQSANVTFTWNAASGAQEYYLQMGSQQGGVSL